MTVGLVSAREQQKEQWHGQTCPRCWSSQDLDLSRVLKSIRRGGVVDLSMVLNQRTERMEPPIRRSLVKGLSTCPPSFSSPLASVSCVLGLPGHSSL